MSTRRRTYGLLDLFGDMELIKSYQITTSSANTTYYTNETLSDLGLSTGDLILIITYTYGRTKSDTTYRKSTSMSIYEVNDNFPTGHATSVSSDGAWFYFAPGKSTKYLGFGFDAGTSNTKYTGETKLIIYKLMNETEITGSFIS